MILSLLLAVTWACCVRPALAETKCSEPRSMYIHHLVQGENDYTDEFEIGTELTYECGPGYFPRNIKTWTATCVRLSNGSASWKIEENDCRPVSCGHPGEVRWGRLLDAVFAFPRPVRYECNQGYRLVGDSTLYCQSNGRWSGTKPECHIMDCGALEDIPNGRVTLSGTTFGSLAEYACSRCFRLVGNSTRTCDEYGKWTGTSPRCEEVFCEPPQLPLHGYISAGPTDGPQRCDSKITYTCPAGTTLVGSSSNSCFETGTWLFDPPACVPDCTVPETTKSAVMRKTYSSWSRTREERLAHGATVTEAETNLVVRCHPGFHLIDEGLRRYRASEASLRCHGGQWVPGNPWCTEKSCRISPSSVKGGRPVLFEVPHGQSVEFTCNSKHTLLQDSSPPTCQKGNVVGSLPICKPDDCRFDELPSIEHGKPFQGQSVSSGSFAQYYCESGFTLENSGRLQCHLGSWTGLPPTCVQDDCRFDELPSIEHGKPFQGQSVSGGSFAQYYCESGFTLENSGRLQCHLGSWTGLPPTCVQVSCNTERIPHIENARPQRNQKVSHGVVASYYCIEGFELHTPGEVICKFGVWNIIQEPKCVRSNDQSSGHAHYSKVIPPQTFEEGFPAGGKQTGGHPVVDHSNSQAGRGCVLPERQTRFFAHLGNERIFSGIEVPDRAELRFHCEPVGELIFGGPNSALCNNGSWSWTTDEPYCYEFKRGDVAMEFRTDSYTGPGGVVYVEPGKEVEVLCNTRSEHRVALSRLPDAKEDQKFRIQDVGDQWNSVLGIFEVAADETIHLICRREDWARYRAIVIVGRYKHNCPLPAPGNGLIIKNTTKGNFEFSCEAQYTLQGRKRVYCLPHSEWEHPLPRCDPAPARPSSFSSSPVDRVQYITSPDRPTASTLPVPKAKQCTVTAVSNGEFIRSSRDKTKVEVGKKLSHGTVLVLRCSGSRPKEITCRDGVLSPSPACQKDSDLTAVETEPFTPVAEGPHGGPVHHPEHLKDSLRRVEEPHHAPQVSVQNLLRRCSSTGHCENRGGDSPQDLTSNIPGTPREVQTSLPEFGRPVETVATGTAKGSIHNLENVTSPRNPEGETPHYGPRMPVQNGQSSQRCLSGDRCARNGDNVHVTSGPSEPPMEDLNSFEKLPSTVEAETEKPVNRATQNTKDVHASSHREDGGRLNTTPIRVQDGGSLPSCPSPGSCLHDGRRTHVNINRTAPGMHGQGGFQESASRNISSNNTSSELENPRGNAQSRHAGPRLAKPPVDDGNFRGSTIPMNSGLPKARDIGKERHDATATNAANMSPLSSKTRNGSPEKTIPNPPDPDNDSKPTSPDVVQTSSATHSNVNDSRQGQVPLSQTDLGSDLEHRTRSSGCSLESFYELAPSGLIINSTANPALAMSNFSASCDGSDLTFIGHGSLVTCLQNGSWAIPVHMKCIRGCDNFDTGPEGPIVEGRKASYQLADSLTFYCKNGTELHPRTERLICLGDQQGWSEDVLPTCIPAAPKQLVAVKTRVKRPR